MASQTNLRTNADEAKPQPAKTNRLDERLSRLADVDLQMLRGKERTGAAFDNGFNNEFDNSFSNIA